MTTLTIADTERGVGLQCSICDRGGAPVAYCTYPEDRAYRDTDVVLVHSITALISAGQQHLLTHHAE